MCCVFTEFVYAIINTMVAFRILTSMINMSVIILHYLTQFQKTNVESSYYYCNIDDVMAMTTVVVVVIITMMMILLEYEAVNMMTMVMMVIITMTTTMTISLYLSDHWFRAVLHRRPECKPKLDAQEDLP